MFSVENRLFEEFIKNMKCKKIYTGQEITQDDSLGTIFLMGPRNEDQTSWRASCIEKIEQTNTCVSIFIPETKAELYASNIMPVHSPKQQFEWEYSAQNSASCIIFWAQDKSWGMKSSIDFGKWHKYDRFFWGSKSENNYLDWLYYKEKKMHAHKDLGDLVKYAVKWLLG